MSEPANTSPMIRRAPWEHPTVSLAGTISLVVRGGSAQGKTSAHMDGDMNQFQCNPPQCGP
jgi:hypothetical protein